MAAAHAFAQGGVYVVAAGMGGHAAGEVASRITADTLGELAGRDGLKVADFVHQIETANFDHMFVDAQQVGGATPIRLYEWQDPTIISASSQCRAMAGPV